MKLYLPASIIALAALLFLLPFRIPLSIDAPGISAPAREWMLVRESAERLVVQVYNHERCTTEAYQVQVFGREDAVHIEIPAATGMRGTVAAGDTLAIVHSTNLAIDEAELAGDLAEAQASLDVDVTGEKDAIVGEARKELDRAKAEQAGRGKERARNEQLLARGVIPQQMLDESVRVADAAREAAAAAEMRLHSVMTGEKDARVRYSRTRINALEGRRSALARKRSSACLCAPFAGALYRTAYSDTLIRLGDTARCVVAMLVPWSEERRFGAGSPVTVSIPRAGRITGHIVQMNSAVSIRQGVPVVVAVAMLDRHPVDVPTGLPAACTISCGEVSLLEYLRGAVLHLFRMA